MVPFADVFVDMPGVGIKEVEERISIPLEKKLREIPGVEYVYSISQPGAALAIVRFYVGEDEERSMVKLHDKLRANLDLIPPGASPPLVKPRSIDDVPILALTLWSERVDSYVLRRIAAQLDDQVKAVPDVSETRLIGGLRRQLRVTLDRDRLASRDVTPGAVLAALGEANRELRVGRFARGNREYLVDAGTFLASAAELGQVVVGVSRGRPVHLQDVAAIEDGPEEPREYVLMSGGGGSGAIDRGPGSGRAMPAVTLSVAKRKGTNAVVIAERVLAKVEAVRPSLIPADVHVTVTRNYGETAREKSSELLKHLLLATVSVTVLIALFLGLRASLRCAGGDPGHAGAHALPVLPLRVHAEPRHAVRADLLHRHPRGRCHRGRGEHRASRPLARESRSSARRRGGGSGGRGGQSDHPGHVRGHRRDPADGLRRRAHGAVHAPHSGGRVRRHAVLPGIAFIVSPWAATRLLRPPVGDGPAHAQGPEDWTTRLYRRLMEPLLRDWRRRWLFFGVVMLLLLAACSLVGLQARSASRCCPSTTRASSR